MNKVNNNEKIGPRLNAIWFETLRRTQYMTPPPPPFYKESRSIIFYGSWGWSDQADNYFNEIINFWWVITSVIYVDNQNENHTIFYKKLIWCGNVIIIHQFLILTIARSMGKRENSVTLGFTTYDLNKLTWYCLAHICIKETSEVLFFLNGDIVQQSSGFFHFWSEFLTANK